MANLQDLGDEEFMAAWDEAGEKLAAAKDSVRAFAAEHDRRLVAAQEADRLAREASIESGEYDPALTQTIGRVEG